VKALSERSPLGEKVLDDTRRPVWLEATESFYKKLNRVAKQCGLSRYDALSRGLDALVRETQIRDSALNRNIKSRRNRKCSVGRWGKFHGIIGQQLAEKSGASERKRVRMHDGTLGGLPAKQALVIKAKGAIL
jgi:hypothetical protein